MDQFKFLLMINQIEHMNKNKYYQNKIFIKTRNYIFNI